MSRDLFQRCELCDTRVGENNLTFRQDPGLGCYGAWVCHTCTTMLDDVLTENEENNSEEE